MSPFEASLRQLARKALDKDLRAILKFVKICGEYGVIAPPRPSRAAVSSVRPKASITRNGSTASRKKFRSTKHRPQQGGEKRNVGSRKRRAGAGAVL
jgi:hypothetical protein